MAQLAARFSLTPLRVSLWFLLLACVCIPFADLNISTLEPWRELSRMAQGLISPNFLQGQSLWFAVLYTVSFGILGTVIASISGFFLALIFRFRFVRIVCAFVRAIHEIFWALIFLQLFGLTPLTGLLAIAVPYAGVFAKVYSEILEESDNHTVNALPKSAGHISTFLFARLPDAWAAIKSYTYYRFECGLRSSAILGFVGLPTIGYFLESAFREGYYSESAAYLFLLYLLIATLRLWLPAKLIIPAAIVCLFSLPKGDTIRWENIHRFFTQDIIPAPLRDGINAGSLTNFFEWLNDLLVNQAWPGLINTIIITQIALVATAILTLLLFPLISRKFFNWFGVGMGHAFLIVLRSTPEYIIAYVLLQLWGPSMLPAVIALTLHNGGIIALLIGRTADRLPLRQNAPSGVNLYSYEIVPRVYGQFLAYLFYRWEIIMRETAVLGILGVYTLGFYVDSAISEIRLDRAMILLLITALLNMCIDTISRRLRRKLHFNKQPNCY